LGREIRSSIALQGFLRRINHYRDELRLSLSIHPVELPEPRGCEQRWETKGHDDREPNCETKAG
jgi:hypothetical protein